MLQWLIDGMIFCGAALMVYNIYGFVRFARSIRANKAFAQRSIILYIPIVLLILFLLGYLAVGIFGKPDLIMGGILFGGSIFVFIMYKLLSNITQRIIRNEQLEAKLMAIEASDRAKASFLASVSHEMRTPMNVILGLNGIALRNPALPTETRMQLEKIDLSAKHLMDMIRNILDMNQLEDATLEIKNEEFSMSDALAQVDSIIQTLCDEKGLTYQSDIKLNVSGRYLGDETQFKRVLLSILENAVMYTNAPGTVHFSVEVLSEADGVRIMQFTTSDTGIGMDAEFVSNLFGAFSREDSSSTTQHSGSGMSLALAKRLVELRDGTITVESEKNVGSTFTVTVPMPYVGEVAVPTEPVEEAISLEGRRILLAEDLPENAEIVMDLLELEGIETDHAENGQIAVDMFSQAPPDTYDAILMDLRMPVMDGLEATRQIRKLDRPDAGIIPIIALTANAFESDVQASLAAGMNAHLAKPADADCLYDTIKRLIASTQGRERSQTT